MRGIGRRKSGITPDPWMFYEEIDLTVTRYSAPENGGPSEELEVLCARVSGPGAYLLGINSAGDISINGQVLEPGTDVYRYWDIFDTAGVETEGPVVGHTTRYPQI